MTPSSMTAATNPHLQSQVANPASVAVPAIAAAFFGLFILWGTGFAQPDALHNAAHDVRHAFAMPCH